jgi:hypothetical protein
VAQHCSRPSGIFLLNATNKKGVYNILSTFGGTHLIPPRMLAMRLRYSF